MKASIILCTYNRAKLLEVALESLLQLAVLRELEWEVLVVDNNSSDSTKDVTKSFSDKDPQRFRYIFEGRQGKSFALNRGVKEAKGEIVVFTDDDVTVDSHWLSRLLDTIETFSCAGVGGRIVPVWNIPKPDWLEMDGPYRLMNAVVSFDLGEQPCPIETAALGANFAFKKEMFQKYGEFRADLGPTVGSEIRGEDSEFCRRLIKAGERLIYAPGAIVYHPVEKHRTEKDYFEAWYFDRGRASVREAGIPSNAIRYFGVPRYLFAKLLGNLLKSVFSASSKIRFYFKLQAYENWGQIIESRNSTSSGK
jgi:GT2 family glycosyltransferase